jgi:type II secretory pathway component PulC
MESKSDELATRSTASVAWKTLHRRVKESQVVQPLTIDELVRDPFDQSWIQEKMRPVATTSVPAAAPVADPLPTMALSAVVVGSDGGLAIINNEVFRVGDEVPRNGPVRYILTRILPDKVVLEREGNAFEIAFRAAERKGQ